jgi:hypothetical protein
MSSPFQKSFSAKSPITTSPLRAGGYGSGVDGMQYVSPKQPESNILPASKPKKNRKIPKKPASIIEPTGFEPIELELNVDNIEIPREERTLERLEKGAEVEKRATTPEEKAKYNAYKKKCKAEGNCNTKYRDRRFYQDQERINKGDWMNIGKEYEKL